MTTIADNIERFIKLAGFKQQADFCRASGIPNSTMVRILKNGSNPSITNLIAIAKTCRVTIDAIVTGHEPETIPPRLALIYADQEEISNITAWRETNDIGKNMIRLACKNAPRASPFR